MTKLLKTAAVAALLSGAALFTAMPASAGVSISIGVPGISFSATSGGYCDRWGCPGGYWDYPVWYGPVYFGGEWYQGPVYYRRMGGTYYYWVRGGWHRDEWRGPRPRWWRADQYHYGPALGRDYYRGHGFTHDNDRYWRDDRRDDRRDHRRDNRRDRWDDNRDGH